MRRWFPVWALPIALACSPLVEPNGHNVLLIVIDTLRADHLETYGYPLRNSPRLYRFGKSSVVFTHSYAASSWTKPSVATLLTSLEPKDHGILDWKHKMSNDALTLAEVFAAKGYDTEAYIGHHALHPRYNNFHQGFQIYDTSVVEGSSAHKIVSSDRITDLAIQAVQKKRDQSFFLYLHYFDPHERYTKHEGFDYGDEDFQLYDSEIRFTDKHIGRLLAVLEDRGLLASSVVVISSDHGEEFRDHGGRGHSRTLYEEVVRVPLMIRSPALEPAVVREPISGLDVAPTILGLVGLAVPKAFRGRQLPIRDRAFAMQDDWPIFLETRRRVDRQGLIRDRWKLIHDLKTDSYQLYNLDLDEKERFDRYEKKPRLAASMAKELDAHFSRRATEAEELEADDDFSELLEQLGYVEEEGTRN